MRNRVEDSHIQEWRKNGSVRIVDREAMQQFASFLNDLPWAPAGMHLDWNALGGSTFSLATSDSPVEWLKDKALGAFPYAVIMYGPDEPGLCCPLKLAIENLDYLFWKAPGTHYLCGALEPDGSAIEYEALAEYDGGDNLIAR